MALAAAVAVCTVGLATPIAGASLVDGLLEDAKNAVQGTVGSGGGSGGGGGATPTAAPQPAAGLPPEYTPPAHGTNPHGQGTVAVVDLAPESTEPLPYDPGGGSEDIVIGRARGEEEGGAYHGHITIVSLLGSEIIGVDTGEGETESGPLEPLQEAVLDALCDGSGNQICLEVLTADSSTTANGSQNRFEAVGAELGGETGITAEVASSEGNISESGGCQTATGESQVASASLGGALTADVAQAHSQSQACNDGSEEQENSGFALVALNGEVVPIPPGCESGTPNTVFDIALVSVVCNADDSSETGGDQMGSPYGVREAASVFLLPLLGEVAKLTTAAGESHAVAPGGEPECPDPNNPACPEEPPGDDCPDPDNPDCPDRGAGPGGGGGPDDDDAGPGGPSGEADEGLPFTGADLSALGVIGLMTMAAGLGLMALADQRRRRRSVA